VIDYSPGLSVIESLGECVKTVAVAVIVINNGRFPFDIMIFRQRAAPAVLAAVFFLAID